MARVVKFVPPSATDRLLGRPPPALIKIGIGSAQGKNNAEIERIGKLKAAQKKVSDEYSNVENYIGKEDQIAITSLTSPNLPLDFTNTLLTLYEFVKTVLRGKDGFSNLLNFVVEMEEIHKTFGGFSFTQGPASESEQSGGAGVPSTPATAKQNKVKPPINRQSAQPSAKRDLSYDLEKEDNFDDLEEEDYVAPPAQPTRVEVPDSSEQSQKKKQSAPQHLLLPPSVAPRPSVTPLLLPSPLVTSAPPVPQLGPAPPEPPVKQLAKAINNVLQRALVPLLDSIGALAFALGEQDVRSFMVYDERQKGSRRDLPTDRLRVIDEEDPKLTTVAYLMERYEPILGNSFLSIYLEQALVSLTNQSNQLVKETRQKLVNACFDFDRDLLFEPPLLNSAQTLEALKKLPLPHSEKVKAKIADLETAQEAAGIVRRTEPESRFAPGWAFSVLGNSVFRAIASPPVLAAFEMAANQVRSFPGCSSFTLKELLCSSATMNQFVFLAARHYMRDVSVLAAAGARSGKKRQGGNYINVNQARKELQERAFVISIWFERVYAVPNPLLAEFDAYRKSLKHTETLSEGFEVSMPLDPAFEARMQQYRDALPQRELRHRE